MLTSWQEQTGRNVILVDVESWSFIIITNVHSGRQWQADKVETEKICEEWLLEMPDGLARRCMLLEPLVAL